MSVRNVSRPLQRSPSGIDHRAIDMAARLLLVGTWVERQFGNAPKMLTTLAAKSRASGPTTKTSRLSLLAPRQFLREER
jgi:hypothetical protein